MSPAAVPFQAERHTKRKRGLRPETERDSQWRRSAGDGIVFFFLCPVFNFCTQKVTEQDLRFLLRFISLYCWLVGSFFFCFVLATKFGQKKRSLAKLHPCVCEFKCVFYDLASFFFSYIWPISVFTIFLFVARHFVTWLWDIDQLDRDSSPQRADLILLVVLGCSTDSDHWGWDGWVLLDPLGCAGEVFVHPPLFFKRVVPCWDPFHVEKEPTVNELDSFLLCW